MAIDGQELTELSEAALSDYRLHHVGFIFQAYNLIPVLTARENVEFVMVLQGRRPAEFHQRSLDYLARVGLSDLANRRPKALSGGQQQRVAVARALAAGPRLVLADEPTANLDSENALDLLALMRDLNRKERMTFLFSTHDERVMERATRVIVLRDGNISEISGAFHRLMNSRPAALAVALLLPFSAVATAETQPFEWRLIFKLANATSRAGPGEVGFAHTGDDTRESNEQTFRAQVIGRPLDWLTYQVDYLNAKQQLAAPPAPAPLAGPNLFRRRPVRKYLERPETTTQFPATTQTVQWFHELDRAWLRADAGPLKIIAGRQPIGWGAGRIWRPTNLFAPFSPLALDTEFRPGVDGLLVRGFPSDFSAVTLAVVASPASQPTIGDSAVLHFRGSVGEETELTLLGGTLRDEPVAGGSLETSWLGAGWRLEALTFESRGRKERETQAVAGVDFRFAAGLLLLAEIYPHTLGAVAEADLPRVAADPVFLEGRLPQLAGTVFGAGFSYEFGGLWTSGYNLLASALRDDQGRRRPSLLHQVVLTYSLSDEAEANFVILAGSGPKAEPKGLIHSEFGHLPDTLLVSVKFVL